MTVSNCNLRTRKAQAKHSASVCLASYDINVLKAWYTAVRAGRGKTHFAGHVPFVLIDVLLDDGHDARLVVLMKDFEQFDCEVVQQMFYICRFVRSYCYHQLIVLIPNFFRTQPKYSIPPNSFRHFDIDSGHALGFIHSFNISSIYLVLA